MSLASENVPDVPTCVEIDLADLREHSEALLEMLGRRLMAVIVRRVYPPQLLASVIERLQHAGDEVPVFRPHTIHKGEVYGWPLVASNAPLDQYLEQAARFELTCERLFGAALRPAARVAEVMGFLAGGRPVTPPRAADGRSYCAATIRFLGDGDSLPCHYENESFHVPALRALASGLDRSTLMSFYVPMAHADAGGELRLYHVDCFEGRESLIGRLGGDEQARPHLEREGYMVLRPAVGDLLLFDGGRFYHEVTAVRGERWTMGGVFAFTHDRRAVHFWG
jgi:hypothetical protein